MGQFIDLTGQRFGRLTAIKRIGSKGNKGALWMCKCECGNHSSVVSAKLRAGEVKSCGCIHIEYLVARNKASAKHNGTGEKLFAIWRAIKNRCLNPKQKNYMDYGGRGITICDEWIDDYSAFRDWALSAGYDTTALRYECTIDRIDNDGPYAPWNCRWVDMKTQASNRRPPSRKEAI